jgi:hypothetical protein
MGGQNSIIGSDAKPLPYVKCPNAKLPDEKCNAQKGEFMDTPGS